MMQLENISIKDKILFFEHHYILGEGYNEFLYFIYQLKLILKIRKELPKAIILGRSSLYDINIKLLDPSEINNFICANIKDLGIDIFTVDHIHTIIPFLKLDNS